MWEKFSNFHNYAFACWNRIGNNWGSQKLHYFSKLNTLVRNVGNFTHLRLKIFTNFRIFTQWTSDVKHEISKNSLKILSQWWIYRVFEFSWSRFQQNINFEQIKVTIKPIKQLGFCTRVRLLYKICMRCLKTFLNISNEYQ